MPQPNLPAHTFHLFTHLPSEIRHQIWTDALAGPPIVFIQRVLDSGTHPNKIPQPTHFTSSSPHSSVISLLHTSQEPRQIAQKHYSLLPQIGWFDYDRDFFYVDLGKRQHCIPYQAGHFTGFSIESEPAIETYGHPVIGEDVARKARNLAVCKEPSFTLWLEEMNGEWLVEDVLEVFSGVKILVFADQFHGVHEDREELCWLSGAVGGEVSGSNGIEGVGERVRNHEQEIEEQRLDLRELILWRVGSQYRNSWSIEQQGFEKAWCAHRGEGVEFPQVFRRSITTTKLKNQLLSISGSETNFHHLLPLDWIVVLGHDVYIGALLLEKQIEYLELVLGRISTDALDEGGCDTNQLGSAILCLLGRIERLKVEWEMEAIVVDEAEGMVWE